MMEYAMKYDSRWGRRLYLRHYGDKVAAWRIFITRVHTCPPLYTAVLCASPRRTFCWASRTNSHATYSCTLLIITQWHVHCTSNGDHERGSWQLLFSSLDHSFVCIYIASSCMLEYQWYNICFSGGIKFIKAHSYLEELITVPILKYCLMVKRLCLVFPLTMTDPQIHVTIIWPIIISIFTPVNLN